MTKDRPESARYGEGDVLPFSVRQHMLLLAYPPFGGFDATTGLAALTDDLSMRAVWSAAAVVFGPHQVTTTREQSDLPKAEGLNMFPQDFFPSVALFKKEFRL